MKKAAPTNFNRNNELPFFGTLFAKRSGSLVYLLSISELLFFYCRVLAVFYPAYALDFDFTCIELSISF